MDLMEKNKLLNLALELINSFPNEEDYVWEEAVEYDDEGNEQEAFCSYKYKVEKVKIPWTNFKKMVDSKKRFNKPLAVFLSEINPEKDWREETLIVYEVY